MNIKINYGTGVATLPTAALPILDRATKADIKVLFLLCAEPYLLTGETREACISRISERAGATAAQIEAALSFWRGAGVLDAEEGEDVVSEPVVTPASEPLAEPQGTVPAEADETTSKPATVTVTRSSSRMLDEIPNYTTDELEAFLQGQAEAATYLDECQNIWGSLFNPREINTVIALVDTWGFQWDYVIALLAFACKQFKEKENQGKSLNYVYRMAVSLHKEGIVTSRALQQKFVEIEKMASFEKRLRDMFGLGARILTPKEKKYISTWLYEYHYDIEIVELAYNITVDVKGAPNISYTNGVLKHWFEDGLKTLEEIIAKRQTDDDTVRSLKGQSPATESRSQGTAAEQGSGEGAGISSQDLNMLRRLLIPGGRMLTEGETAAFTKWRAEYGFSYEIIHYAYQITLENRGDYNLPYMDAILRKWNELKLTTIEAIKAYEMGFKEDKKRKKKEPVQAPSKAVSFDVNDFFMDAVKRSFGEDFDPTILDQ